MTAQTGRVAVALLSLFILIFSAIGYLTGVY